MEKKQQEQEAASFEQSVNNTRLESQPNELLTQVKAQVSAQEKARCEKGEKQIKTRPSV
jgi:hypothetical protein